MLSFSFTDTVAAMPLRCLVVDDDPTAIQVILQCLARIPSLCAVGTCANALDALDFLRTEAVDVLFLDIVMPLISGIDLLQLLRQHSPKIPYAILTTSSTTHAAQAFEYHAVVDYLLKPITFSRFSQAIDKLEALVTKELMINRRAAAKSSNFVFIKDTSNQRIRISFDEVYYFEASNNYVHIILEHKKLTVLNSLRGIQKRLPVSEFIPIHRSFLVNIRHIESVATDALIIKNKQLPISLPHRAALLERLHIL